MCQLIDDLVVDGSSLGTETSRRVAEEVLIALDRDGNGIVERDEFMDWVMKGLVRPRRSRRLFAQKSTFHATLDNMLCGIENAALCLHSGVEELPSPAVAVEPTRAVADDRDPLTEENLKSWKLPSTVSEKNADKDDANSTLFR